MDLLACAQNKLHDPIAMNWALRRYRHADLRGSDTCREMERLWFHDLILSRWLDSDDSDVLATLFRELPARLFANLKPAILSRWMGWSGTLGASATPALMECAPEEAALLFGRHIDESVADLNKTFAVFSALVELPSDVAQPLLDKAMLSVAASRREILESQFSHRHYCNRRCVTMSSIFGSWLIFAPAARGSTRNAAFDC